MNTQLTLRRDLSVAARRTIVAYLSTVAVIILLMMVFGLLLRAAQAQFIPLSVTSFYELMTLHGAGMVGIAGLGGATVMWYFLSKYVQLSWRILLTNFILFLIGFVLILAAVVWGNFAAGWTFLYPLPVKSMGSWGLSSAIAYMSGLLIIGIGFLLFYLDTGRAIIIQYGGLGRALGWHCLFGKNTNFPPSTVVASTMVIIVNTIGIVVGAVVLVISLMNAFFPEFQPDPLFVKSLIYFFGHVFINASIYMAVIAVYEILPLYTGRPWKVNKVFLLAWNFSTLMVVAVVPHHLLMDFNIPTWLLVLGQVASYFSGIPVIVVTVYGGLLNVFRSGIRWDLVSGLLFVSLYGWVSGVIPAIVDATIQVNSVMHNTQWVPGHFHYYLIIGLVPMLFGFMLYLSQEFNQTGFSKKSKFFLFVYLITGVGFVMAFLYSGKNGVPRRWAEHWSEWLLIDQFATFMAVGVVLSTFYITLRFIVRVPALIR